MKKNQELVWQPDYASFPVDLEIYEEKIEYMDSVKDVGDFIHDCIYCVIENNNSDGKIVIKKIVKKV